MVKVNKIKFKGEKKCLRVQYLEKLEQTESL